MARKIDPKEENKKGIPLKQKKRELSLIFGVIIIIILLFIIFMLVNQNKISTVGKSVTTQSVQTQNCNQNGDNSECGSTSFCAGGTCVESASLICVCSETGYGIDSSCPSAVTIAEQDVKSKLNNPNLICNKEDICGSICSPPKLISSVTTTIINDCAAQVTMSKGCKN